MLVHHGRAGPNLNSSFFVIQMAEECHAVILNHNVFANIVEFQYLREGTVFPFRYLEISHTALLSLQDADADHLDDFLRNNDRFSRNDLILIREYMNICRCVDQYGDERECEFERAGIPLPPHTRWQDCLATRALLLNCNMACQEYCDLTRNVDIVYHKFTKQETYVISRFFILLQLGFPRLIDIVMTKTRFNFELQDIINVATHVVPSSEQSIYVALYLYMMRKQPTTKAAVRDPR